MMKSASFGRCMWREPCGGAASQTTERSGAQSLRPPVVQLSVCARPFYSCSNVATNVVTNVITCAALHA